MAVWISNPRQMLPNRPIDWNHDHKVSESEIHGVVEAGSFQPEINHVRARLRKRGHG